MESWDRSRKCCLQWLIARPDTRARILSIRPSIVAVTWLRAGFSKASPWRAFPWPRLPGSMFPSWGYEPGEHGRWARFTPDCAPVSTMWNRHQPHLLEEPSAVLPAERSRQYLVNG